MLLFSSSLKSKRILLVLALVQSGTTVVPSYLVTPVQFSSVQGPIHPIIGGCERLLVPFMGVSGLTIHPIFYRYHTLSFTSSSLVTHRSSTSPTSQTFRHSWNEKVDKKKNKK